MKTTHPAFRFITASCLTVALTLLASSPVQAELPIKKVNQLIAQGRLIEAARMLQSAEATATPVDKPLLAKMLVQLGDFLQQQQADLEGPELPEREPDGFYTVTHLGGFTGSWIAVGARDTIYTSQKLLGPSKAWPSDEIEQQEELEFRIAAVAGDKNGWLILMSRRRDQLAPHEEVYGPASADDDMDAWIRRKTAEGLRVTSVAGFHKYWVVVMNAGTGWGEQVWLKPPQAGAAAIREWWEKYSAEGYALTALNGDFTKDANTKERNGASFFLVATKGTNIGKQELQVEVDFPTRGNINSRLPVAMIAGNNKDNLLILRGGTPVAGSHTVLLDPGADAKKLINAIWNYKDKLFFQRVEGLPVIAEKLGWDEMDTDKFLAVCGQRDLSLADLKERYPGVPPSLIAAVRDEWVGRELANRLKDALNRYVEKKPSGLEAPVFWEATNLLDLDLLRALGREYITPPRDQKLTFDPFTGSQDGVAVKDVTIGRSVPGLSLEVIAEFQAPRGRPVYVSYLFVPQAWHPEPAGWRLVDIRYTPVRARLSLRQALGMADGFNVLGMRLISLPGAIGETPGNARLAATEVTVAQYHAVLQASGGTVSPVTKGGALPITGVSWNDAVDFCEKLNGMEMAAGALPEGYAYRLPTTAEWMTAYRSDERFLEIPLLERAWIIDNTDDKPQPVATRLATALEWSDLDGNVAEWCRDPESNQKEEPPTFGGSFGNLAEHWINGPPVSNYPATNRQDFIGFRVILAPHLQEDASPNPDK